tara:strand:+ start:15093 stop:15941 length:849 start_codon:yes stop_codon:yes gene_type:complete
MNILTFDIEEWFHILDNDSTKTERNWTHYEYRLESNMERILQLLQDNNQNATFFCLGWVARKFPQVIKKIDSLKYEIGSHGDIHQLAYNQNRVDFVSDLSNSIKSLEDITSKKVKSYRAPGFSIKNQNKWAFEKLVDYGIEIDCSVFPAKRAHGGLPQYGYSKPSLININGKVLKEFPINTFNILNTSLIFSGGGYFRLLPYTVIRKLMNKSDYVMTYFHPRDFDCNQPIIKDLSLFRKFKSYYGLKNSFKKLNKLIRDFDFIDLKDASKRIDWENVETITL